MIYKIDWMEKKSDDWIVATLLEGTIKHSDVSINRTNKKGEVFPLFDNIQAGREVEGAEIWVSQTGKKYLFALSKPRGNPNYKSNQIAKAQDNKAQQIAKAQDRSAWMWAKTNACTLYGDSMKDYGVEVIAENILTLATKIYNGEPVEPF